MPTLLGPAAIFLGQAELFAAQRTPSIVHFQIKWSEDGTNALASQTFTIPVKAGTFVHEVSTFVSEAFTTSGSNASLAIGDGTSANGYLATTDTVLQTIDTATTSSRAAGEAFANGKYYAVDDTLDFVFVAAASGATAGCVKGFVVLSNVTLDGIEPAADGDPLPASSY
jgi:hypothetical protein